MLRIARLFRLARIARLSIYFHEIALLLRGITESMRVLAWAVVVIFVVTFAFAAAGLIVITKPLLDIQAASLDDDELQHYIDVLSGMDTFLYTLIQVLTQDADHLLRGIMSYMPWSWIFFFLYEAIGKLVLLNLVTAIIVDNALKATHQDEETRVRLKEKQKREDMLELKTLFDLIDTDGNGSLSWDEFEDCFEDEQIVSKWQLLDVGPDECQDLFKLLDKGDGNVDMATFIDGLSRMKGNASSKDIVKMSFAIEHIRHKLHDLWAVSKPSKRGISRAYSNLPLVNRNSQRHEQFET